MKVLFVGCVLVALVFAGCMQSTDEDDEGGSAADDFDISHVHGLAYDPDAGAVFVATHNGLARGVPDGEGWSWSYVGTDRYDYMGFTQDAERPGVFYSSGHPDDAAAFGGPHLGLRRSTDGGETWEQRSLKGEVDFHALTSIPGAEGWLAGFWQGAVKVSTDGGASWTDHPGPGGQTFALAATDTRLVAATADGLFATGDLDTFTNWTFTHGKGLPQTALTLAMSPDESVFLASAVTGMTVTTHRSVDAGVTWTQIQPDVIPTDGAEVLFAVDPADSAHVFASTNNAMVLESSDAGETWTTIRTA